MTPRREFLKAATVMAFLPFTTPSLLRARHAIRTGALGEIPFCRVFADLSHRNVIDFLFDFPTPLCVTTISPDIVTFHYPDRLVSFDPQGAPRIALYGTRSTLIVQV
jgi:hypothetical protein